MGAKRLFLRVYFVAVYVLEYNRVIYRPMLCVYYLWIVMCYLLAVAVDISDYNHTIIILCAYYMYIMMSCMFTVSV